jgi:hypothetical protein
MRTAIGSILALMIAPHQAGALSIEPMEIVVRGHVAAIVLTRRTPEWVSTRDDIPEKQRAAFVDQHYRITLVVDAVERGKLEGGRKQIEFSGWCVLHRPPGWPAERHLCKAPLPRRGDALRVHLKAGIGRLVVSPSGYEMLRN